MAIRPRPFVRLTARWGHDDADSSIRISCRQWAAIRDGAAFSKRTWSWYEGRRESVEWMFADGLLSVNGQDAARHLNGLPVSELLCEEA